MTENYKKSTILFVFLSIVVLVWVLLQFVPVGLEAITDCPYAKSDDDVEVGGLYIMFEEGVTEPEVKQILGNYDFGLEYELDYNIDYMADSYYLMVDKDERTSVKYELAKVDNRFKSGYDITKGNYYIIGVQEEFIADEDFLEVLDEQDLQLKHSVWCYLNFSYDYIDYSTAKEIKKELEENEVILFVGIDDVEG